MVTQALLIWLVTYVSCLAVCGFVLFIVRSASRRRWGDATILRASSLLAFVGASVFWVLLLIVD